MLEAENWAFGSPLTFQQLLLSSEADWLTPPHSPFQSHGLYIAVDFLLKEENYYMEVWRSPGGSIPSQEWVKLLSNEWNSPSLFSSSSFFVARSFCLWLCLCQVTATRRSEVWHSSNRRCAVWKNEDELPHRALQCEEEREASHPVKVFWVCYTSRLSFSCQPALNELGQE